MRGGPGRTQDVYDVRRCAVTDALYAAARAAGGAPTAWPVYVAGSARAAVMEHHPRGRPCGFLTLSDAFPAGTLGGVAPEAGGEVSVVLVLMPYNYPRFASCVA